MDRLLRESVKVGLIFGAIITTLTFCFGVANSNLNIEGWSYFVSAFLASFSSDFAFRLVYGFLTERTSWGMTINVVLALIAAIGILAGALSGYQTLMATPTIPFQSHIDEYLALGLSSNTHPPEYASPNPIRGKIVTVDVNSKSIDPLFLKLPENLKAKRPDEVGTVVFLTRGTYLIRSYTDGSNDFASTCDVTVVDMSSGAIIATNHFIGKSPPLNNFSGGSREDTVGPAPDDQILEFLENIPHVASSATENGSILVSTATP